MKIKTLLIDDEALARTLVQNFIKADPDFEVVGEAGDGFEAMKKITELQPDIVVFDRFMVEEQFGWRVAECCPNALRILDTIDLHCLRLARQVAVKEQREFSVDDLFSDTAKREIASILRCDVSLMVSEFEK